ncbi:MAG: hypothetical protein HRT77_05225 [Halioglobus sp.]|nr:hypothetical protein [Halioglobus sp.]
MPVFFSKFSAVLSITLGIYTLWTALNLWQSFHLDLPIRDTLRAMPFVIHVLDQGLLSQPAEEWFAAHSGAHRIAITRLALVVDHAWFAGNNNFIYLLTGLGIITLYGVFLIAFRRTYPKEVALQVFVAGLLLCFLLSHTQTWNMVNPINSSWYVASSSTALSIFLIARKETFPSVSSFLAAYILAVVSALSNFSGVFIFLILPLIIGIRHLSMGLVSAAFSTVFLLLYLHDIPTGSMLTNVLKSGSPSELAANSYDSINTLIHLAKRISLYLGSPLSIEHPRQAAVLVALSIGLLGLGWVSFIRHWIARNPVNAWLEICLTLATLMVATSLATTIGRGGMLDSTAERYQTVVMLYWLCICGLILFYTIKTTTTKPWILPAGNAVCLAILVLLTTNQSYAVLNSAMVAERASRVSALSLMGVSENLNYRLLLYRGGNSALKELDTHFKESNTSYWRDNIYRVNVENTAVCNLVPLELKKSEWPGISTASVRIPTFGPDWRRSIPVSTGAGDVIGYLLRDFSSKVTPLRLNMGKEDRWTGYIRMKNKWNGEIFLHLEQLLFPNAPCRVKTNWNKLSTQQ